MTRWATFDCYGTLIDWMGGIRAALASLFPDADADHLLERYHHIEREVQRGRAIPYRLVMRATLMEIVRTEALRLPAGSDQALGASLPTWPPFPEVPGALADLRERGWRIAILSNTDPDLLDASVQAIGVPVDRRVTAADAGAYKPAHAHWERFFADTGADRASHVHVAASLFHDIAPAAELGLTAVWINRQDERSTLPRAAERTDLRGLGDVLDGLVPA